MLGLQKLCSLTTFLPKSDGKLCMVANISNAQAINFEVVSTLNVQRLQGNWSPVDLLKIVGTVIFHIIFMTKIAQ